MSPGETFAAVNGIQAVGGSIEGSAAVIAYNALYVMSGYASYGGGVGNALIAFTIRIDGPAPFAPAQSQRLAHPRRDTFAARLLGHSWQPRSRKTLDELIAEACERFSVTRALLMAPSRQRLPARTGVGRASGDHLAHRQPHTCRSPLRPQRIEFA